MSGKTYCFFHAADHDGHTSGTIVKLNIPDCIMKEIDYGIDFPFDLVRPEDTVYMVDFSLQPFSEMIKLNKLCNFIWIDHHFTAIEDMKKSGVEFKGLQKTGLGACGRTWEYFHPNEEMPRAIRLLAEYDVFTLTDPQCLDFEYGMRSFCTNPMDDNNIELYKILINEDSTQTDLNVDTICQRGKVVQEYLKVFDEHYMKLAMYEVDFEGLRCLCLNRLRCGSQAFDIVPNRHEFDAFIAYGWIKDKWTVGMYSDRKDIDVASICKKYGGGGHVSLQGSCGGFEPETLPEGILPK